MHVAVGVILDDQGRVLLTKRAAAAHQGGLWEFPGGKVQADETVQSALARELLEELGIEVQRSSPLVEIQHRYADKSVLLDVHTVWQFSGTAAGLEGQPLEWVEPQDLAGYPFPAANEAIVTAVMELLGLG